MQTQANTKPRFFIAQITLPWLLGVLCVILGGVITAAVWKYGKDSLDQRQDARLESLENNRARASDLIYDLRTQSQQLDEIKDMLKAYQSIPSDIAILQFRMGNVEYALGVTPPQNVRKPPK